MELFNKSSKSEHWMLTPTSAFHHLSLALPCLLQRPPWQTVDAFKDTIPKQNSLPIDFYWIITATM